MKGKTKNKAFRISKYEIKQGELKIIKFKVTEIYISTSIHIPVCVINGKGSGPVVTIISTIHGDELNGIETIRRLEQDIDPKQLSGTLILVPIANPISFIQQQRDLPDGIDLNRVFPGRSKNTMSAILANTIFTTFIKPADFVIDLHTAAKWRMNVPYVKVTPANKKSMRLAFLSGAEFIFEHKPRHGMLRYASEKIGKGVICIEAGEPMKFHPSYIQHCLVQIRNILAGLGMYSFKRISPRFQIVFNTHKWLRAKKGGILVVNKLPADFVRKDDLIAYTTGPFSKKTSQIKSPCDGIILGFTTKPTTMAGEAVCHIFALDKKTKKVVQNFAMGGSIKLC